MKSYSISFAMLAVLIAGNLSAQPGSIASIPAPAIGPVVFDGAGNIYSFTFGPVTPGAIQTQNGGGTCLGSNGFFSVPGPCPDAYVGKLDSRGNLVFGTYLGGLTADQATALAVDAAGNVFVIGTTGGAFPTSGNAAIANSTTSKTFAAKISPDGSRLIYSTYLPDTVASPAAISVDSLGQAYIAGASSSGHAVALKLNAAGSAFVYNVSLAGSGNDAATAIATDIDGSAVLGGHTSSGDFPVSSTAQPNTIQNRLQGAQNAFVTKLDTSGRILFSTFLGGGNGVENVSAIGIDSGHNIYVAGSTTSLDFRTTPTGFQSEPILPLWNNNGPGGFVAKIDPNGADLLYSTFVPSSDRSQQGVTHLAVTASGDAYISGLTGAGFPVTASAPQICFDGFAYSAFVAHINPQGTLADGTYAGHNVLSVRGLFVPESRSVVILADSSGASQELQIRFNGVTSPASPCLSPSVLNSATLFENPISATPATNGNSSITPGELVTLTGFGIGPEQGIAAQPDTNGQMPTSLAGVEVFFDGKPAPVFYAQSRQVNTQVPVDLLDSLANITLRYNQSLFGAVTTPLAPYGSPGIFRLQPGQSSQAYAQNQDGSINSVLNPAPRGSVVSVYGTGFGLIDPTCPTGGLNSPTAVNLGPGLRVMIAESSAPGVPVTFTPVTYAGSAPFLPCGIGKISFVVPNDAPPVSFRFFPWSGMDLPGGDTQFVPGPVGATIWVERVADTAAISLH